MDETTKTLQTASAGGGAGTEGGEMSFGAPEEEARPWRPDPGDTLRGMLTAAVPFEGKGGQTIRIFIKDKDGVTWSVIAPSVLKRLFAERWVSRAIDIGTELAVIFDGEKPLQGGGKLKLYRMKPDLPKEAQRARAQNAMAAIGQGDLWSVKREEAAQRKADEEFAKANLDTQA